VEDVVVRSELPIFAADFYGEGEVWVRAPSFSPHWRARRSWPVRQGGAVYQRAFGHRPVVSATHRVRRQGGLSVAVSRIDGEVAEFVSVIGKLGRGASAW